MTPTLAVKGSDIMKRIVSLRRMFDESKRMSKHAALFGMEIEINSMLKDKLVVDEAALRLEIEKLEKDAKAHIISDWFPLWLRQELLGEAGAT